MISFTALNVSVEQFARHWPHHLAELSLLRDYAYQSSLKYLGAGKTAHEIAHVMKCTEATVNFQTIKICQRFDIMTSQQAVVKALALG